MSVSLVSKLPVTAVLSSTVAAESFFASGLSLTAVTSMVTVAVSKAGGLAPLDTV